MSTSGASVCLFHAVTFGAHSTLKCIDVYYETLEVVAADVTGAGSSSQNCNGATHMIAPSVEWRALQIGSLRSNLHAVS